jgi:hypothetical protein
VARRKVGNGSDGTMFEPYQSAASFGRLLRPSDVVELARTPGLSKVGWVNLAGSRDSWPPTTRVWHRKDLRMYLTVQSTGPKVK